MWTPRALASEAQARGGLIWRVVEHQYTSSTRAIVGTLAEQTVLEDILEDSKPPWPAGAESLHYLLKTPFRYRASWPSGTRFRAPDDRHGVFYASEQSSTALAEMAWYRRRFFSVSPATPLPRGEERLSAFSVGYQTARALDLTAPPLDADRNRWTGSTDYTATQALAAAARTAAIAAIRYESVRDPRRGANVALLTPAAFTCDAPLEIQTWLLYLSPAETSFRRVDGATASWVFPVSA